MTPAECTDLLRAVRAKLERHLFDADGELVRDDIAELWMKIDDALLGDAAQAVVEIAEGSHASMGRDRPGKRVMCGRYIVRMQEKWTSSPRR